MVQNCPDLEQYVQFLKLIEQAKATGQKQSLTWSIREAVRHNILKDYLERKGGETLSILTAEYDFDTAMAVKQEEAYADGISIGLERGAYQNKLETAKQMLSLGLPVDQIQRCTSLPMETIHQLVD